MKKVITLLLLAIFIAAPAQNIIVSEDTVFNESVNASSLRINPNVQVTFKNNLSLTGSILFLANTKLIVEGSTNVGKNIFFQSGHGTFEATGSVFVSNDITGNGTGEIIYCDSLQYGFIGDNVKIAQDCSLSISLQDFVKTLPFGEPYKVYNVTGQFLYERKLQSYSEIYVTEPKVIVFPNRHYSKKMILKPYHK